MKMIFLIILIGLLQKLDPAFGSEIRKNIMFDRYSEHFQTFDPFDPGFGGDPTHIDFSPSTSITFLEDVWRSSPSMTLDFRKARVQDILDLYQATSGLCFVTDTRVPVHALVTVKTSVPVSKAETLETIERALVSQAGVVITRLDDNRASVTYNDQLNLRN
jgi:hypothetical protein